MKTYLVFAKAEKRVFLVRAKSRAEAIIKCRAGKGKPAPKSALKEVKLLKRPARNFSAKLAA